MRQTLQKEIEEMKRVASQLTAYTVPQVSFNDEHDVMPLKQRMITVDGYHLIVVFSKANYDDYFLDSLQIQSSHFPYLPFHLVCKVGKAFMGSNNLSFIEFDRAGKKVYCWTIKYSDGIILEPRKSKPGYFEGFEFRILSPDSLELK